MGPTEIDVFVERTHPMRDTDPTLNSEQVAEAERIFEALQEASREEQWRIARLLASKSDDQIFGATEHRVRDAVHRIGSAAIQTALRGRKKGGTEGPA